MPITPGNRDTLRERAFAMSARGKGVREIASTLGINKDTAAKYVRQERQRRSHDREAEEEVKRAIGSMRILLDELWKQWNSVKGDGPHAGFAKARLAESMRKVHRDLVALYGVELPETDGEKILEDRGRRVINQPLSLGFPEVGEQAAVEEYIKDQDAELREHEDFGREFFGANWEEAFGSLDSHDEGY
jgi:transposase-like protein